MFVLVIALIAVARPASAQLSVGVGDLFPDFTALDQDNVPFTLSDHRGRVVLLHICAMWCNPCRAAAEDEEAVIDALNAAIGAENWLLVDALHTDNFVRPTDQADATQWRSQFDTPALTLHASGSPTSELSLLPGVLGAVAYPTYVVIAPDGSVSAIQVGYDIGLRDPLDGTAAVLMQMVIDALAPTPDAIIDDLLAEIDQAGLAAGTMNSLSAMLRLGLALLTDDNTSNDAAAAAALAAFINQVQAQAGHKIPEALAAEWISVAQAAIDAMGG
jgi:thiol-disulfide isomerase/thioredoxin